MAKQFRGTINIDIKDSVPDWEPYAQPIAPDDAPNVLYVVLDDVGFSAMESFGGLIETPNIDRIADRGLLYTNFHTTALCSPTRSCLLTGRNHTTNGMACITEASSGFPNASGHIPGECAMIPEVLGERGWNTYMVGKWHLCPEDEMNLASTKQRLAARSRLRALLRLPRRRDEPVVSRPRLRQPPGRAAEAAGGRLPLLGRHHRQGDLVHPRREGRRADKPFFLYYAPAPPTRRTTRRRSGPTSTRASSTWATRRTASSSSRTRRSSESCRSTPSSRRSTRTPT